MTGRSRAAFGMAVAFGVTLAAGVAGARMPAAWPMQPVEAGQRAGLCAEPASQNDAIPPQDDALDTNPPILV